MLAEIFLLKLQAALRETAANAPKSNARFVPVARPRV
jgi:hypothetical protein